MRRGRRRRPGSRAIPGAFSIPDACLRRPYSVGVSGKTPLSN